MKSNQVTMNFRVDGDLKKAFEHVAEALDQSASQLLRAYMRNIVADYAHKTAQKDLFRAPQAPQPPKEAPTPTEAEKTPHKPKKGQKLASVKPANWRMP